MISLSLRRRLPYSALPSRDFQPDPAAANTRWCGDITYVATEEGWLYL
ncbi:hypothetical protein [Streptomyces sp. NPDC093097]